jgi:hypothetical protein
MSFKPSQGQIGGGVCYLVFDWWGVSTATQIRLYTGLLSVLPLRGLGCHYMRTALLLKELVSLPKPRGKRAKANQHLSAQQKATCNSVGR